MKKIFWITLLLASFAFGYSFNTLLKSDEADAELKRVTGLGGIFFKSKDPVALKAWYQQHLGLKTDQWGTMFEWRLATDSSKMGLTQWSPFKETTKYFQPSAKDFMINYRVADLNRLVLALKNEGVTIVDTVENTEYGKFVHIMDMENNKIELWEPVDAGFDNQIEGRTK